MLTIQNVKKDVGTTIGSYELIDAGLSNPLPTGTGEYYAFHWTHAGVDSTRKFKFLLDRIPSEGTKTIYRLRLYDGNRVVQGTNRDGFVYEAKVGRVLLKDRVDFYQCMIGTIEQYK